MLFFQAIFSGAAICDTPRVGRGYLRYAARCMRLSAIRRAVLAHQSPSMEGLYIGRGYAAHTPRGACGYLRYAALLANVMQSAITMSGWTKTIEMFQQSCDFMNAIQRKDSVQAAKIIEEIHDALSVPMHYNSEGDLTAALLFATNEAWNYCIIARELPSSRGYADVVLIPSKPGTKLPPTIFELKLDDSTESAIQQIEEEKYFAVKELQHYHGEVLAVAMIYDRNTKPHRCDMRTFEI